MTDTEACRYTAAWDRVEKLVRPFRARTMTVGERRRLLVAVTREPRQTLYEAIANLDRVLVIAQTSRTQDARIRADAGKYSTQKLVVFATDQTSRSGILGQAHFSTGGP